MGKVFRRVAIAAGVSFVALVALYAVAWQHSESALAQTFVVRDPPLAFAGDAAEAARGAHLYGVLGCVECHGEGGRGKVFIDAGPVAVVVAPNLTPAAVRERYDADALGVAIRHGLDPRGRPLRIMPSTDFMNLSDEDTAALVAYLQALPASDNRPGSTEIRVG